MNEREIPELGLQDPIKNVTFLSSNIFHQSHNSQQSASSNQQTTTNKQQPLGPPSITRILILSDFSIQDMGADWAKALRQDSLIRGSCEAEMSHFNQQRWLTNIRQVTLDQDEIFGNSLEQCTHSTLRKLISVQIE